jgi:hypothetical protein
MTLLLLSLAMMRTWHRAGIYYAVSCVWTRHGIRTSLASIGPVRCLQLALDGSLEAVVHDDGSRS